MSSRAVRRAIEMWGGVECTVNRVGDRWFDQLAWSGHDRRPDDLIRFAALGLRALRYPILWERMTPRIGDGIDWRWADERLALLRDLGVRPIVGLVHHGSGPAGTSLLDPAFPEQLAGFAAAVADRYPWITDYTPINEPLTTARFSALYGHWYPHARSGVAFVRALLTQARAIVLAMRAIRARVPEARLVQTEDCGRPYGTHVTAGQVDHEDHRRWLTWDLLTGHVDHAHPLSGFLRATGFTPQDEAFFLSADCAPDVLGLNYYVTSDRYLDHRLPLYPAASHGGNGIIRYADVEAVRARPAGIAGHEAHLADAWRRYRLPVAITEVHLACTREEQLRWLVEAWSGAHRARDRGVDVRAVTAWALLGSMNWNSLVTEDAGHYEPGVFDVRGPTPRPTALASVVASLSAGQPPDHPALAAPGWWRRAERLSYGNTRLPSSPLPPDRPILIVGASGTLGRAFQRICALRGLPAVVTGRPELDITDPATVDSALRRTRPWAVVNAAGYVDVDGAERDRDACFRANTAGPANLAAACRRRGLPLVTYSSDLVFDGAQGTVYCEEDAPQPLNVYGESKAEGERKVLALLPQALVIRTSAFFGPWDRHNFLSHLFRALDRGRQFTASHDVIVSPTYIPDLVHASLDLLMDQASGVWHLANDAAVSWFDFAMLAAERSGRPIELIAPAASAAVYGPARRPPFSALSSSRGRLLRPLEAALDAFLGEYVADVEQRCASR